MKFEGDASYSLLCTDMKPSVVLPRERCETADDVNACAEAASNNITDEDDTHEGRENLPASHENNVSTTPTHCLREYLRLLSRDFVCECELCDVERKHLDYRRLEVSDDKTCQDSQGKIIESTMSQNCKVTAKARKQELKLIESTNTHTVDKIYQHHHKTSKLSTIEIHKKSVVSQYVTEEKPYKCNVCDYKSNKISNLKSHSYTHANEKPYKCHICDFKTARGYHLTRHEMTHTGEKPYKCNMCDYKAKDSYRLKIHKKSHSHTTYTCKECNYKTKHIDFLRKHLYNTHTNEKPYECLLCDYKTGKKNDLTRHQIKHSGEKPYACDMCDFKTGYNFNLITHKNKKHT